MEFKDYGFKPCDVINGLNKYYSEKDSKYLHITREKHAYWHLLDKDVTDAINWLREEHNIFYTPGMKLEDPANLDIFDTPRYHFLSTLSAELGFRTIVGPGNADKVENDILKLVKHRAEQSKAVVDNRREFLRKLGCELGVLYPVVKPGSEEKVEADILERIWELKEGNWPCENGNTFAAYMRKQFPKECEKWNVTPLQEGSVHDWVQYIFGILDEWRKRASKAEKERDRAWSYCGKYKSMLHAGYGASCGDNVLPCYRDTCNNPKAASLRKELCKLLDMDSDSAPVDILKEIEKLKSDKYEAVKSYLDQHIDYLNTKDELQKCREDILTLYREIFDCSDGDPEGSDKENLEDILDEYRRVVHNFEERTADWSKAQQELDRYKLAVCSVLGIPKETRDDINAIERSFAFSKKMYESLQEFRNDVCEIFDIPSSMKYDYIVKEIHDIVDRYDELENFRSDIARAVCANLNDSDADILKAVEAVMERATELQFNTVDKDEYGKICEDYAELRKAIWEAMGRNPETLPEDTARLVGEVRMLQMNYAGLQQIHDEVAKAIGMDYPVTGNDIINRVKGLYDANGSNLDVISDLNRQVTELKHGEKLLIEFRDEIAKAIGITYPTTNNFIVERATNIYKDWGELNDLVPKLRGDVRDLQVKCNDMRSKFEFQSGLRQQWHARYESEHERANGVQKCLDKTREALHVKDVSLETAKKEYEKVCGNLETAECALNGMKSKVRSLQEEKTKVISALGQDIWDDAVK